MRTQQSPKTIPFASYIYDAEADKLYLFAMDTTGFVQCVAAVTPEPAELAAAPIEFTHEAA